MCHKFQATRLSLFLILTIRIFMHSYLLTLKSNLCLNAQVQRGAIFFGAKGRHTVLMYRHNFSFCPFQTSGKISKQAVSGIRTMSGIVRVPL